jgi:hypothetical protein
MQVHESLTLEKIPESDNLYSDGDHVTSFWVRMHKQLRFFYTEQLQSITPEINNVFVTSALDLL